MWWLAELNLSFQIEVFLPPKQRRDGKLEVYNLNYNIAIVSVEKSFCHSWPENIFKTNLKLSKQAADTVKSSKKGESSEEKGKSSEKKGSHLKTQL